MIGNSYKRRSGPSIFQGLFISYLGIGLLIFVILGLLFLLYEINDNLRESKAQLQHELDFVINYFDQAYAFNIEGDLHFIEKAYSFNIFLSSTDEETPFTRSLAEQLFINFTNESNGVYLSARYIDAQGNEQVVTSGNKRVKFYISLGHVPGNTFYGRINTLFQRLRSANLGTVLIEGPFKYNDKTTFLIGISKSDPEIGGFSGAVILHCDLKKYFDFLNKYGISKEHGVEVVGLDDRSLFVPRGEGNLLAQKSGPADFYSISRVVRMGSDNEPLFKINFYIFPGILYQHTEGAFRVAILSVFLVILPVIGLMAFFISRYFSKPLISLADNVDRFAKGDLSVRAKINATGELGALVESFNNMANDLQKVTVSRDELEESEKRFMSVIDSSPDSILLTQDGKFCECNDAAVRMFGFPDRKRLLGSHPAEISPPVQPDGSNSLEKAMEMIRIVNERGFHGFEWTHRRADGEDFPCEVSLTLITFRGRSTQYGVVRDISLMKRSEKDLKTSQAMLLHSEKLASIGLLAAGVAHEINNPVGFISNNMEILQEYVGNYNKILRVVEGIKQKVSDGDVEKAKAAVNELEKLEEEINVGYMTDDISKLLDHSRRGLERVQKIVLDLRTFAREENAENMELIRIEEVMDGILNIVLSNLKYKVEIFKEYGETPLVNGNAQRLGQVFMNLLVNAGQAIEEKGKITIKSYKHNDHVCLEVSDTGKGIPEENLKKIFDPFFTTKPVGKGTGLGLSVCHEIIRKHGGEIKVSSKIGEGSTFTVMLPLI